MRVPIHASDFNVIVTFFGGYMLLFTFSSLFIVDKLYFGPSTFAFLTGIIFGPRAVGLLDLLNWRHIDTITLEFSRIVLAVQCFVNGIELPKYYIERQWKSLAVILGPVMISGWLISACFVKVIVPEWDWRQCLVCAACFNSIDPILAATVLNGRSFSLRVPKHLRDLLRAEAAANGIITTVLLDLAVNLVQHRNSPAKVAVQLSTIAVPYETGFGVVAGYIFGWFGRWLIRWSERKELIDRPSFLAFFLSAAVFCTGIGTLLGVDEVLFAFVAGFSLDRHDWYQEKTEESHVAKVIDLLLNLSYFVFLGSILPWEKYKSSELNINPWRMVVGTLGVFLGRRIPVVAAFKPITPNVRTWREAMFYGHFGPIGAGAIFSALLIKGKLTPGPSQSVENTSEDTKTQQFLDQLWVVTTFVVLCSSIFHGMSIPLFQIFKKVNTLTIVLTYSKEPEPWMDRLPRINSVGPASAIDWMSETHIDLSPPPVAMPSLFLRRQGDDASLSDETSPPKRRSRRRTLDEDILYDETSPSDRRSRMQRTWESTTPSVAGVMNRNNVVQATAEQQTHEGNDGITSEQDESQHAYDDQGHSEYNTMPPVHPPNQPDVDSLEIRGRRTNLDDVKAPASRPSDNTKKRFWEPLRSKRPKKKGPAHAYQFGNTIVIEDDDGEVIKTYIIPTSTDNERTKMQQLTDTFTSALMPWRQTNAESRNGNLPTSDPLAPPPQASLLPSPELFITRPTSTHLVTHSNVSDLHPHHQRRSTQDFLRQLRELDPASHAEASKPRARQIVPEISVTCENEDILSISAALLPSRNIHTQTHTSFDMDTGEDKSSKDKGKGRATDDTTDIQPFEHSSMSQRGRSLNPDPHSSAQLSQPKSPQDTPRPSTPSSPRRGRSLDPGSPSTHRARMSPPETPTGILRPFTPTSILRPSTPSPSPSPSSSCRKSVRFSVDTSGS